MASTLVSYDWLPRLDATLKAQQIPITGVADVTGVVGAPPEWHVVTRPDGIWVRIDYMEDATTAEKTEGDDIALTFDVRPYRTRRLADIYKDIIALSIQQQQNIWADLSAPVAGDVPRKYLGDTGPNAAAIFVMDWTVQESGATGQAMARARSEIMAMYTQSNPTYLQNPPFDPSISVPATEPIA